MKTLWRGILHSTPNYKAVHMVVGNGLGRAENWRKYYRGTVTNFLLGPIPLDPTRHNEQGNLELPLKQTIYLSTRKLTNATIAQDATYQPSHSSGLYRLLQGPPPALVTSSPVTRPQRSTCKQVRRTSSFTYRLHFYSTAKHPSVGRAEPSPFQREI